MVITLLSDFGIQDSYVASAKGSLLQHASMDHIVDISHAVTPFDLRSGSYILKSCYKNFPKKTIHLVLLDLLHQRPAKAILLHLNDQWIISADNGFLSFFWEEASNDKLEAYSLPIEAYSYDEWIDSVAKIIGKFYSNPHELLQYNKVEIPANNMILVRIISENLIECMVRHIDHFGNIIFDITKSQFEQLRNGRKFTITLRNNEKITEIVEHYEEIGDNKRLARFNSTNHLEIAVRNGRADQLMGYKLFHTDQTFYTTITIEFHAD